MFVFLLNSAIILLVVAITVYVIMRYQRKHCTSSATAGNFPDNVATNINSDAGDQNYKIPFDMMCSTDGN